jgi:hypothetical protein
MKKSVVLLLIILHVLLISCGQKEEANHAGMKRIDRRKPLAWGHRQTIYVLADNTVWQRLENQLRKNFERIQFTTGDESFFEIKRADFHSLDQFYKYNNLIFFCDLQSNSSVSAHVKSIMTDDIKQKVEQENMGLFPVENVWANDQYVLFVIANNEENVARLTTSQSETLFELFMDKLVSRIALKIYQQKLLSEKSFTSLPWFMKIPQKYVVFHQDEKFISFLSRLRNHPDKFLAVYYEDMLTNTIDEEWLINKRLEVFGKHYDGDTFKREDVKIISTTFKKYDSFKISGRWQNEKAIAGGAFQSFAFYDEVGKRAYLIDHCVYFPQGDKLAALLELEVISKTIELKK